MSRNWRAVLLCVVFASVFCYQINITTRAAAGGLDLTFGSGGKVTTDLGLAVTDTGQAVAIQPDGKIVVAGSGCAGAGPCQDINVVRYNANGTLDASFGVGGKATAGLGASAFALSLQSDGKIVIAGNTHGSNIDFAVVRFNGNGSLDAAFGSGGVVTTDFFGGPDFVRGMAIQADGKIIIAGGAASPPGDGDFALARYNPNGSLDSTFDGDGKLTTRISAFDETATAVAIQPDGRIVASGSGLGFTLIRYDTGGSLDAGFGAGGIASAFGGVGLAMALQPDGRIVLAGFGGSLFDFAVARFDAAGHLDPAFGSGGIIVTPMGGENIAFAVAIQSDGRILAGGYATNAVTGRDFAIARYNFNGALDPTFGVGGKIFTDFSGGEDLAFGLALQTDGKIVAAGFASGSSTAQDFAVARYDAGNLCLQDDRTGDRVSFNPDTGAYLFTQCGAKGVTVGGVGKVIRSQCQIEIKQENANQNVLVLFDPCRLRGSATITASGKTFVIADSETSKNTCTCP